jgi:hypothetical protein
VGSNNDLVVRALRSIPQVAQKTAVFVQRDGLKAIVNVGDTTIVLPFVGLYLPPSGHAVQLELRDGQWVVTGPATPLPGEGTITATGSPRATVTAWGTAYTLRYKSSYTPVLNDLVSITWSADEGIIEGKLTAASALVAPGANPGAGVQRYHPDPFTAVDSGTYRSGSGWWTNTVRANVDDGAWFYGSKIKNTIPDSAVIIQARLYVPIQTIVINAPGQLRLHQHASKPGGAPTYLGSASPLSAVSGWRTIPKSFIDYLKANDGGIGFDGGGQWVCYGVASDALSGALDIIYDA